MYIQHKDTNRLKIKGWKKLYHASSNPKKAGTATALAIRGTQIKTTVRYHPIVI